MAAPRKRTAAAATNTAPAASDAPNGAAETPADVSPVIDGTAATETVSPAIEE